MICWLCYAVLTMGFDCFAAIALTGVRIVPSTPLPYHKNFFQWFSECAFFLHCWQVLIRHTWQIVAWLHILAPHADTASVGVLWKQHCRIVGVTCRGKVSSRGGPFCSCSPNLTQFSPILSHRDQSWCRNIFWGCRPGGTNRPSWSI